MAKIPEPVEEGSGSGTFFAAPDATEHSSTLFVLPVAAQGGSLLSLMTAQG